MTSNKKLEQLRGLSHDQLVELAQNRSCHLNGASPHERRMFVSGFRKGVRSALRGERAHDRAQERRARGRNGDDAWANGFSEGVKHVPVERKPRKRGGKVSLLDGDLELTSAQMRRMKKRGRL